LFFCLARNKTPSISLLSIQKRLSLRRFCQ
jgi:hypothetical protein